MKYNEKNLKKNKILVTSCHKDVKSRYFALKYATDSLVCYKGLVMMQGFHVIEALASSSLYNSQALHHWAIITNSGIYCIH